MSVALGVLAALLVALLLRLRMRRRNRRASVTPLGGIASDFASPYRVPGRRRSGQGF